MFEKIYFANNGGLYTYKWDDYTFFLYLSLLVILLIADLFIQPIYIRKRSANISVNLWIFGGIFMYFLIICSFRELTVGRDTQMYSDIFNASENWKKLAQWDMEPGYYILNSILKTIFPSKFMGIIVLSFLILFLSFKTIFDVRKSIDVFLALFLFVGIGFYLQSFNLLRISLCACIELYFFHYIIEKKYLNYFIVLLLCSTIHYTALLMMLPFASYYFFQSNIKYFFVLMFFIVLLSAYVATHLDNFIFFARYEHYTYEELERVGIGSAQFLYNIPILALSYYMYQKKYFPKRISLLMVVYCMYCFLYGIVGYYIPVGRAVIHFLMIYVLLVPYSILQLRVHNDRYFQIVRVFFIFYGILRYHLYLKDYLYSDGIMPYNMLTF